MRLSVLLAIGLLPLNNLVGEARADAVQVAATDEKKSDSRSTPEKTTTPEPVSDQETEQERLARPLKPLPEPLVKLTEKAVPLNPDHTVFLDKPGQRVIVRSEVACNNCVLEMLCVPEGIKEHETILRMRARAYVIHTALLALGMDTGTPAVFSPKFEPPAGPTLSIYAAWVDAEGQLQRKDVRHWIRKNIHRYFTAPAPSAPPGVEMPYKELRFDKFNNELLWFGPMSKEDRDDLLSKWTNARYQNAVRKFFEESQSTAMDAEFVFVGSRFFKDPDTGENLYLAEGGYVICVANFADSLIDIREASSASDGSQAYEAWTERIPPEGTPVLLEIVPVKARPAGDSPKAQRATDQLPPKTNR